MIDGRRKVEESRPMGCQGRGLGTDLGQRLSASGVSDLAPHSAWPPCLTYTMTFFPNKANLMNKQLSSLQSLPPPATMSLLYLLQGLKFQNDRHIPLGSESFLVFKQMFLKSVSSYDSIKYPLVMRLRRCRLSNFWTSTMYQALFCALYHVWSQSILQQKMLRRATKHLAEEDSTEIKTQKGLNCKLGDKGLKNFRHFTIMPWSSPAFYYFSLTSIKCLLLLFPITEGRAEYALHYAGYKKKKNKNNPRQWKYVHLA